MKIKVKKSELYYYVFFFLVLIYYSFRNTILDHTKFEVFIYASIPFIVLKFLNDNYTLKEAIIILMFSILGLVDTYFSKNEAILISFCCMLGMKGIKKEIPLKMFLWMHIVATFFLFLMTQIGILEERILYRDGNVIRRTFGYFHPNVVGIYCFILITLWFYLYKTQKIFGKVIIALVISFGIFYLTNCRASVILTVLFASSILFSKFMKEEILRRIAQSVIILSFLSTFIIQKLSNTEIIRILDKITNYRISLSNSYLKVYGISLFGKSIYTVTDTNQYWYLDSGWLSLLLRHGLIIGLLYIVLTVLLCQKIKNKYFYVIIIFFSIYGTVEDVIASTVYNYLWILIGWMIFNWESNNFTVEKAKDRVI